MKFIDVITRIVEDNSKINESMPIISSLSTAVDREDYSTIEASLEGLLYLHAHLTNLKAIAFLDSKFLGIFELLADLNFEHFVESLFSIASVTESAKSLLVNNLQTYYFSSGEPEDANFILQLTKLTLKHSSLVKPILESISKTKTDDPSSLLNCYNFLIAIDDLKGEKEKLIYQNIFVNYIKTNCLNEKLTEHLFLSLSVVFRNADNPLIFSDYLLESYKNSNSSIDHKILALNSLFVLLTKYSLNFPDFYEVLYETIGLESSFGGFFQSKFRNKMLKILNLTLLSPSVPYQVVCSFIKYQCKQKISENESQTKR